MGFIRIEKNDPWKRNSMMKRWLKATRYPAGSLKSVEALDRAVAEGEKWFETHPPEEDSHLKDMHDAIRNLRYHSRHLAGLPGIPRS